MLHALSPPEVASSALAAHERAVDAALDYVERRALAVRRGRDGVVVPVAADAVASAGFVHRVSRALDPHLHSHVVMANLGCGPEGKFSALDGRGVYVDAAATGALYHAELRHELTARLGVAWEPLRQGRADVAGIGVDARRGFAGAAAIAEHLSARGSEGPGRETSPAMPPVPGATRLNRSMSPGWGGLEAGAVRGPRRRADRGRARRAPARPGPGITRSRRRRGRGARWRGPTATRRDVVRRGAAPSTGAHPWPRSRRRRSGSSMPCRRLRPMPSGPKAAAWPSGVTS